MKYQLLEIDPPFKFNTENLARIDKILLKYPTHYPQSAVLPLLDMAQRQNSGWLCKSALDEVAQKLNMPFMRVYEIATFYSMFNLKPTGKYLLQFCRTTPCWLKGAEEVEKACKRHLNIEMDETTEDGVFTLKQVECLGACINAPVIQINDDYYENLNEDSVVKLLDQLRSSDAKRAR